jgi:Flp pilus assembly protein TadG
MSSVPPARLASEDVIINAPMSYAGSAQRIMRMRRRAQDGGALVAITAVAVLLVVVAWAFVTVWYLTWGLLLVPYRLLRRGSRKRKAEAIRHRELMGTIQGSAAASAATIVGATAVAQTPTVYSASERVADDDRESVIEELHRHTLAGRLTTEEFEERLGSAHTARTRGDLDVILIDLPMSPGMQQTLSERGKTGFASG